MKIQNVLLSMKTASAGGLGRPVSFFWFIAVALAAPFLLLTIGGSLANNLPWYFWAAILLLLLAVISIGFLRFTHPSRAAEDISIRPDRR
jgi:hypothetical protein